MSNQNRVKRVSAVVSAAVAIVLNAVCSNGTPMSPTPPPSPPDVPTVTAYILPGAVALGGSAFGDEPVVIHKGERLRFRNADRVEHNVVADTRSVPEFDTTGTLAPGSERQFIMNTAGMTTIHCTIHPQMAGTLVVQEH